MGEFLKPDDPLPDFRPARRRETPAPTLGDIGGAGIEAMRATDLTTSRGENERRAEQELFQGLLDDFGGDRGQMMDTLMTIPVPELEGLSDIERLSLSDGGNYDLAFALRAKAYRDSLPPERREKISDPMRLQQRGREIAMERYLAAEEVLSEADTLAEGAVAFGGGVVGAMTDPANLASMLIFRRPTKSFVGAVGYGAATSGVTELALQPIVQQYREEVGLPAGWDVGLANVLYATIGGGAFGAVEGGFFKLGQALEQRRLRGEAGRIDAELQEILVRHGKGETDTEGVMSEIRALAEREPAFKASLEIAARQAELDAEAEMNPFGLTPEAIEAHKIRLENAAAEADGKPRPFDEADFPAPPTRTPDVPAEWAEMGLEVVDYSALARDPARFQFKESDADGVTEALRGVEAWEPERAGVLLVWEAEDGTRYVANGHQRHALAQRLMAEGGAPIRGPAFILREADGVSADEAMVRGALVNIGEGSGTSIDAARILRVDPEVADTLPPRSPLVREARGLAALSDDAFGMVLNGQVPARWGALVGRSVADQDLQGQIALALSKADPRTATEAQSIIEDLRNAPVVEGVTLDLFGEKEFRQAMIAERAKVKAAAMQLLRTDQRVFGTLTREAGRIEREGNQLDTGANQGVQLSAARLAERIEKEAHVKGEVSDALNEAARRVAAGTPPRTAAKGLVDALSGPAEGGSGGRGADPGSRSADQAETPPERLEPLQTSRLPGFGTPEFEQARRFDFDGEEVVGYEEATRRLTMQAEAYAGPGGPASEFQATIFIGPPGAGKSTVAKGAARVQRAALVNDDDPKFVIPEFQQNGKDGGSIVHEEASLLASRVMASLLREGKNVAIEKLGKSWDSIEQLAAGFNDLGYEVRVVLVTAPRATLKERIQARGERTGRFTPDDVLDASLAGIGETMRGVNQSPLIKAALEIDNSGAAPHITAGREGFPDDYETALQASLRQPGLVRGSERPEPGQDVRGSAQREAADRQPQNRAAETTAEARLSPLLSEAERRAILFPDLSDLDLPRTAADIVAEAADEFGPEVAALIGRTPDEPPPSGSRFSKTLRAANAMSPEELDTWYAANVRETVAPGGPGELMYILQMDMPRADGRRPRRIEVMIEHQQRTGTAIVDIMLDGKTEDAVRGAEALTAASQMFFRSMLALRHWMTKTPDARAVRFAGSTPAHNRFYEGMLRRFELEGWDNFRIRRSVSELDIEADGTTSGNRLREQDASFVLLRQGERAEDHVKIDGLSKERTGRRAGGARIVTHYSGAEPLRSGPDPVRGSGTGRSGDGGSDLGADATAQRLNRPPARFAKSRRPTGFHDDLQRGSAPFFDERLTPSQNKAAEMARNGYSNAEIAEELHTSPDTVSTHLKEARKLGIEIASGQPGRPLEPGGRNDILSLAQKSLWPNQIAERLGKPVGTVKVVLSRERARRLAAGEDLPDWLMPKPGGRRFSKTASEMDAPTLLTREETLFLKDEASKFQRALREAAACAGGVPMKGVGQIVALTFLGAGGAAAATGVALTQGGPEARDERIWRNYEASPEFAEDERRLASFRDREAAMRNAAALRTYQQEMAAAAATWYRQDLNRMFYANQVQMNHWAQTFTGVDAGFLDLMLVKESGRDWKAMPPIDPATGKRRSTAYGGYQFLQRDWIKALNRWGPAYGFNAEGKSREQILEMRSDPRWATVMAAELARDNARILERKIGRPVTQKDAYLAHFAGPDMAAKLLRASPDTEAYTLDPKAAQANPEVFYVGGNTARPRTVRQIIQGLTGKFPAKPLMAAPHVDPKAPAEEDEW